MRNAKLYTLNPLILQHQNWHRWKHLIYLWLCRILNSVHIGLFYEYMIYNDFVTLFTISFLLFCSIITKFQLHHYTVSRALLTTRSGKLGILKRWSALCSFYPRDAMLARVFATATCPDVCPSVRLSHASIVPSRAKEDCEMYTVW